jgi:hypothetical protein
MKKFLAFAALLLITVSASALEPWKQDRSKRAVEGYGHISMSEGVNYSAGGAFIWGKQRTKGFFLGAGTGLRYVHSVHEVEELGEGTRILYYGDEAVIPVFIRARFGRVRPGKIKPFVTADIGTAINFGKEANTKGFFFEPQIGLDLAENVYVTLGVDTRHFLRRSIVSFGDVVGTIRDPEKKVKGIMSTGLSLHVGYSF